MTAADVDVIAGVGGADSKGTLDYLRIVVWAGQTKCASSPGDLTPSCSCAASLPGWVGEPD